MIIGQGRATIEPGFVWAPYIPRVRTALSDLTDFAHQRESARRFAESFIGTGFITRVEIIGPRP